MPSVLSTLAGEVSNALRFSNLERADAGLLVLAETPIQQAGGLIPVRRAAFANQSEHHGDHQAATTPLGRGDECLLGCFGPACLAAKRAGIPMQQLVLVHQR